ncbi:sirohydrochlorin chelatase [Terasakiella pusilla]|uniref:sirohydrochlorin chelatase n=1 Tax=Terasakiella pusilla TaxID=64973 RepID=UPI003AA83C29
MSDKPAIMICGHGSRDEGAVEEFNLVAKNLRERFPDRLVESGFLEFATPIIRTGLDKLAAQGAKQILCLPGMLFAAGHVKNDLPSEINNFAVEHEDIDVRFGRELAIDRRLLEVCKTRIEEAEAACDGEVARADTLLMVVGRGTNDSDANSNVHKVMRMLWEGMGFGWGEVCYSGVAVPRVPDGLEHAAKLGYKRIIVMPYFLFTGILVNRIYDQTDEVAAKYPDIQFVKTSYLKDHPLVIDAFVERVEEMLSGDNNMNCQLCKYREQIIGYEGDVGAAQVGHHHHVMGIGTDGHHHHDHGHAHDHGHDHGHHHPHGHDHGHHHHDHTLDHPHHGDGEKT